MSVGSLVRRRSAAVALSLACAALVAACSSSGGGTPASTTGAASTSTTTSAPVVAAGNLPTSCGQVKSFVNPYVGGVALTRALGPVPTGVSCEFANSGATKIVIVNIGQGNAQEFAVLRTTSGQNGRTTTPVSGLGSSAFSISNAGKPGGMAALSSQGVVFSVSANIPFAQDEALIKQLMSQF